MSCTYKDFSLTLLSSATGDGKIKCSGGIGENVGEIVSMKKTNTWKLPPPADSA